MTRVFIVIVFVLFPIKIQISSLLVATSNMVDTNYMTSYVTGNLDYSQNRQFVKALAEHSSKGIYLEKRTYEAFGRMYRAALQDDVKLIIISGARSFSYQKSIWERKWQGLKQVPIIDRVLAILKYSAMPATSRHHWGTDIDINSLENSYFESGKGLKEYAWLCENAGKFGFCQVYTAKDERLGRNGYEMEKWHWSYMPIASNCLWYYVKLITPDNLGRFSGAETASDIDIIGRYVLGISSCE